MTEDQQVTLDASSEQIVYARILEKGMFFGLAILLVTYVIYVFGIMSPYIPLPDVPRYWTLNVQDYLQQTNIHPGWAWVAQVGHADFLNFVGVAVLAAVSIVCFLAIIPVLLKNGDKTYAVLALAEVIILCVAASGILGAGGH